MTNLKVFFSCLFACAIFSNATFARQYPTTQYQGFGAGGFDQQAFATSSPASLDPDPSASSQISMSPDSWGTPATNAGTSASDLSEFRPSFRPSATTPNVPDLNDSKNFQPASIYGNQPVPLPNSSRYPLQGSDQQSQDSILNQERNLKPSTQSTAKGNGFGVNQSANDFSTPEGWYGPVKSGNQPAINMTGLSATPGMMSQSLNGNQVDTGYVMPSYRPDLGHRESTPSFRQNGVADYGKQFDFENKKTEYPPMSEILATGRYFGSANMLFLKGHFQGNTAISTSGGGFDVSTPFDFDYEAAPQFRLGFESKYGPGIELDYWQFDETSNVASFVSDGAVTGTTSTWMLGANQLSRLQALNTGDRIDATHTIDVESFGASFFKEVKFKISRLNGKFGFQYVSLAQSLDATLTNGGVEIGSLNSRSDLRAYGPKFGIEYYRPVGHTKLEFLTAVGGSVMFGQRDQFVQNTATNDISRIGADEFVTAIDFMSGVQYKKMVAENRAYYARLGMTYQAWIGGGTANDAQGDLGLRGISFAVGYNR